MFKLNTALAALLITFTFGAYASSAKPAMDKEIINLTGKKRKSGAFSDNVLMREEEKEAAKAIKLLALGAEMHQSPGKPGSITHYCLTWKNKLLGEHISSIVEKPSLKIEKVGYTFHIRNSRVIDVRSPFVSRFIYTTPEERLAAFAKFQALEKSK